MLKHIKKSTFLILCAVMFLVLLGAMVLGINLGAVDLRPDWIYEIILNNITGKELFAAEWSKSAQSIVWGMRFPKVIVCPEIPWLILISWEFPQERPQGQPPFFW